jgi:sulfoxide reductase heme-binding subunit YedZ
VIASLTAAHSKTLWYVMRGTGFVSLLLLTLTMAAGIANVRRWSTTNWTRSAVTFLHRNVSLLAVVFLALHIATAVTDKYIKVGLLAIVVPFTSQWKPLWVGVGTMALDIMLALVATSLLRNQLGHRLWRGVHWFAYLCWPLAALHGFKSGTDSTTGWARDVYVLCIVVVVAAGLARLWGVVRPARQPIGSAAGRALREDARRRPPRRGPDGRLIRPTTEAPPRLSTNKVTS